MKNSFAGNTFARAGMLSITIATPIAFNLGYGQLASRFRYPEILRDSPTAILKLFAQTQHQTQWAWLLLVLSALSFSFISIWIVERLYPSDRRTMPMVAGIFSGLVQAVGLSRWLFAVPAIEQLLAKPENKEAVSAAFVALHGAFGMGIGEFLGYLLTALWTFLVSVRLYEMGHKATAVVGTLCSIAIGLGCAETMGVSLLGPVVAIGYLFWSLWLIAVGIRAFQGVSVKEPLGHPVEPTLSADRLG